MSMKCEDDVEGVEMIGTVGRDVCDFKKGRCKNHEVELLCSKSRRKLRTKCKDSLYRTTYRIVTV